MIRGVLLIGALLLSGTLASAQQIVSASYDGPTQRYPHGVLGDDAEYTVLRVRLSDGTTQALEWGRPLVFEDIAPRLADLNGDGAPEVITVESHEQQGGRLSIYGLQEGRLTALVAGPFIGTRFRWLAPVGAADLDGDGAVEIAYVDRPHLAKTLRVWRVRQETTNRWSLREVAQMPGLSNHRIGWDYIVGGIRDCGAGPEMIVTDASWSRVMAVTLDKGALSARPLGPYRRQADTRAALACRK